MTSLLECVINDDNDDSEYGEHYQTHYKTVLYHPGNKNRKKKKFERKRKGISFALIFYKLISFDHNQISPLRSVGRTLAT